MPDLPSKVDKPLGGKCYGHICHLPGSRLGPGDHKLNPGQDQILTAKARDRHDVIVVQEKLDGTNVGVARVNGTLVPLIRAGYPAISSKWEQHRFFANWVFERLDRFEFLQEGQRLCGEWLAQAHGTRYDLTGREPFVPFDLIQGDQRLPYEQFAKRVEPHFPLPKLLSLGPPRSIEWAMQQLLPHGFYGALDEVEGAVWRVERKGKVDFLGKYVRPEKKDGCFLPELTGSEAIWNWRPAQPSLASRPPMP